MSTTVSKKTFSIKSSIATKLEEYKNKSKFVNEALSFYIDYLDSFEKHKTSLVENKIKESLEWEFYSVDLSSKNHKNELKYSTHSDKLEKELFLAIND